MGRSKQERESPEAGRRTWQAESLAGGMGFVEPARWCPPVRTRCTLPCTRHSAARGAPPCALPLTISRQPGSQAALVHVPLAAAAAAGR